MQFKRFNRCQIASSLWELRQLQWVKHTMMVWCLSQSAFPLQTNSLSLSFSITMATTRPACSRAVCYVCHTTSHMFEKAEKELCLSLAELPWCHWWGVWLKATHHRRRRHHHWSYYGEPFTFQDKILISHSSVSCPRECRYELTQL